MIKFISKLKSIVNIVIKFFGYLKYFFENYVWKYVFQYISIFLLYGIITFKKGTGIIFLNAITNDSIFSAIHFLGEMTKSNYYANKYVSPFIENMNLKMNLNIMDRYIYYFLLQVLSLSFNILFWGNYNLFLYMFLILTTHPYILEYVASKPPFSTIIKFLNKKINKIIKHSTLSLYSYSFNNICINILDKNPNISAHELNYFYKNKSYSHLTDFLKVLLISLLIQYLESIGSIYTRLIKILYNYGALIEIKSEYNEPDKYSDIKNPKEKILRIIDHRDWQLFFNPKILKIIIQLYKENKKEGIIEKIHKVVKHSEIIIGKIFAFYSISVLLDNPIFSSMLSIGICYINNLDIKYYLPRIISLILWLFGFNIFYITLVSEAFELLYNKLSNYIINKIKEKIYENRYLLIHENKYNFELIINSLIGYISYNFWLPNYHNNCYILFLLVSLINKNPHLALYVYIFGWFSNYNIIQLSLNGLLLYLTININNHKTTPKQNISANLINSYLDKQKDDDIPFNKNENTESVIVQTFKKNINETKYVNNYMDQVDKNDHEELYSSFLSSGIIIPKNSSLVESYEKYKEDKIN